MHSIKFSRFVTLFLLTLMAAIIFSCQKNNDPIPNAPTAYVSLYQSSPDAPGLNIIVDNNLINNNSFNFGDYTGYLRFYTGSRDLRFGPFGASNVVLDTAVTFEDKHAYSIFVVDKYQDLSILLLNDDSATPATGKAKVRFLNLSPDTPSADLMTSSGDTPIFNDQGYKAVSEYIEVNATHYDFKVSNPNNSSILTIPATLQSGWYYTIVLRGYSAPPGNNNNVLSAQILVN